MTPDPHVPFLAAVFARANMPRQASDFVFDFFDDHYELGEYGACDALLRAIEPRRLPELPATVLVAILAAGYPGRHGLPYWNQFVDRVHAHLLNTTARDEADAIERMYR